LQLPKAEANFCLFTCRGDPLPVSMLTFFRDIVSL